VSCWQSCQEKQTYPTKARVFSKMDWSLMTALLKAFESDTTSCMACSHGDRCIKHEKDDSDVWLRIPQKSLAARHSTMVYGVALREPGGRRCQTCAKSDLRLSSVYTIRIVSDTPILPQTREAFECPGITQRCRCLNLCLRTTSEKDIRKT
jgi:hypothetical protein